MNEKEILNEILENTKTVKTVVVEKFNKKPKQEKSAKAKAESKFKMVGTKLNEKELEELNIKINKLDYENYSQFFKMCCRYDFEKTNALKAKYINLENKVINFNKLSLLNKIFYLLKNKKI